MVRVQCVDVPVILQCQPGISQDPGLWRIPAFAGMAGGCGKRSRQRREILARGRVDELDPAADASRRLRARHRQPFGRLALRGRRGQQQRSGGDAGDRAHRRARQIRPPIHLRRAGHGPGRPPVVSVPVRADHPDFGAQRRDPAYRPRRHGVDQLCRALSRGPHLCLDRPFEQRPGGVERRHQLACQGGAQFQPRTAHGARAALRGGERIRRCRARAVGLLGRRRDRRRQGLGHLHRPGAGPAVATTRGGSSRSPGRSTSRARRRATRSSSRPAARPRGSSSRRAPPMWSFRWCRNWRAPRPPMPN